MHSPTGIVAGLASLAVIAISTPAAADTVPILPPVVDLTIEVLPRSPTTTADEVDAAATATTTPTRTAAATSNPASAKPIKTQSTSTREQALRSHGGGTSGAARQEPTRSLAPRSPAPSPRATLRRAAPEPPAAAGPVGYPAGRPLWIDLVSILASTLVAMFAMALMSRRGRSTLPNPAGSAPTAEQRETAREVVDGDGAIPEGMDPASIHAARRIARRLAIVNNHPRRHR